MLNIILITVDALRADHLSYFGYPKLTTPNIDNLCEKSVLFIQAISQNSHTPQSFPSIFASVYPLTIGTEPLQGSGIRLPTGLSTVTEKLHKTGYITAAFHSNPYLSRAFNYHKGFEIFDDDLYFGSSKLSLLIKRAFTRLKPHPYLSANEINRKALSFVEEVKDKSVFFFLWLHYMDIHGPYQPSSLYTDLSKHLSYRDMKRLWQKATNYPEMVTEEEKEMLIDLYDGEIKYLDSQIKHFMLALKDLGVLENTLLIITSDHGEEFGEHGKFNHPRDLYDELIHVPLIFYSPSILPKAKEISQVVGLIDLAPTILELIGIKEDSSSFQGRSIVPLIIEGTQERRIIISEASGENKQRDIVKFAARSNNFKYIVTMKGQNLKKEELYDLTNDPKETLNLAENVKYINQKKQLKVHLIGHIRKYYNNIQIRKRERIEMDKSIERRLRNLGYL